MKWEEVTELDKPETGLQVQYKLGEITADFNEMESRLKQMLEPFEGATREGLEKYTAKELKPFRADLNKLSKALSDKRLAVKREYIKPLEEFEARVKELDALIQAPCKLIDDVIKEKENTERHQRELYLIDWYYGFCEANGIERFSECVPFERVLKKEWLNKSFPLKKACDELDEKMQKILLDYQAVQNSEYYDPKNAVLDFFETLDIATVVRRDIDRKAAVDAANGFEAEVEANMRIRTSQDENPSENGLERRKYAFTITCTEQERDELVAWFKSKGITGTFKEER